MARFKYHNVNPIGERTEDCVTRAICLASGKDYYDISEKLFYTAKLLDCERLCVCCYRHLLDHVFKYKYINCDGMTVNEFADKHPYGVYLVRMNGHISCIIDNCIYDIWDCGEETLTDAWEVE